MLRNNSITYILCAAIFSFLAIGCGGSSDDDDKAKAANTKTLATHLVSAEVIPANNSSGTGTGTITLDSKTRYVTGSITLSNVTPTSVEIRQAYAGDTGTTIIILQQDAANSTKWNVPANAMVTADQADLMMAGGTYAVVNTAAYPNGEIRGQLLTPSVKVYQLSLTGAQENPPVTTTATGTAVFTVNKDTRAIVGSVTPAGLTNPTMAHIHKGMAGDNGPVVVGLVADAQSRWVVPNNTVLTQADLDSLLAGGLYVNIHTAAHPDGEIRGQILPSNIRVYVFPMTGDKEVPPVVTTATGHGAVTVNTDTGAISGSVQATGLTGATTAYLQQGVAGATGPNVIQLTLDPNQANRWVIPANSKLSEAQLTQLQANALYANVNTATNPTGEIRGQLTTP